MPEKNEPLANAVKEPVHDVAVLGGGSFGSAMAKVLGENGHRVHFWMRDETQVEEIRTTGINSRYMPGVEIKGDIQPTADLAGAVDKAEIVFVAIPSKAFRAVIHENSNKFRDGQIVVSLTKGIEAHGFKLMEDNILNLKTKGLFKDKERCF